MPRPQRIEFAGAWYHVMNRSGGRRTIFRTDKHRRLFLDLLAEISETFSIEVHAYCLIGNHYHLLVCTPKANLNAAMRHLGSVYTQRHNRSLNTDGALFRGRYKAVLIDADNYLAQVSRYIHLNPVAAGLTTRPAGYRWSSYGEYIDKRTPPNWLHVKPTLGLFGPRRARERYQAFVEQGIDEALKQFYGKQNLPAVLGAPHFLKTVRRKHKGKALSAQVHRGLKHSTAPNLKTIAQVTAKHFHIEARMLYQSKRGRRANIPRAVAMMLARQPGGYRLTEIAKLFRVGDISAVSASAKRLKARLSEEPGLGKRVATIKAELFGR